MKNFLSLLCLAALALSASAANSFDVFVDRVTAEWVRLDPLLATDKQYFTGAEQDALDRQLTPVSHAFVEQKAAVASRALGELKQFDRAKLNASQRISAATLQWQLEEAVNDAKYDDFTYPLNQFTGAQSNVISYLNNSHPIRSVRDAENYLARVGQIPALIDTLVVEARRRDAKGIRPPRFILTATIEQMQRLVAPAPKDNILVMSLAGRAALVANFPAADCTRLAAAVEKIVGESVYPAYARAIAELQGQLPRSTDAAGLSQFPGGEEAYAWFLKKFTTTDYTAAQIHEIGLKQVARIEAEMTGIFNQLGFTAGSIKERYAKLEEREQPKGTEEEAAAYMLATYEKYLHDAEARSKLVFDLTPKAPCIVKREPAFTEKNAAAHYTDPSKDGSRPGIFWAPLPGRPYRVVGLRSLTYHEAIPGHHFQVALQIEQTALPRFRSDGIFGFISAHGEGWALYAERLATENNWYDGDPVGRIGQLGSELHRARRLVADTGLHTKQWTRQQGIDLGITVAEIERYVVWPGQATAYKIGEIKILELRAKAQAALGPKFSLKEFHNIVLRTGGVPLAVLEQVIDDWIAAAR